MKLDFEKEAYGAGDEVAAELTLQTNANQPLANHAFNFVVQLAGETIINSQDETSADGFSKIKFPLPHSLNSNDGLLNVMIQYQGLTESISRSVPIVLNKIQLT